MSATATSHTRHRLEVDFSERGARLLELARESGRFDVRMARLPAGDYVVAGAVIVERKTYADFATSLADGRLFRQVATLAHSPHRPVILLEGPAPARLPDVHPHALKGAIVSLSVMWRLPVILARDSADSLCILQFIADQAARTNQTVLRRWDRKPKRASSRKLYVLQGLPGIGPALAQRLLVRLGSIERVVTADEATLCSVRGVGATKAARIRELVG